ncbi:Hypothetical protein D9617_2g056860 [Elsinoe fawcettii]|nr:Hypothetical protein D9617_2g056860 [Elsinoe fawcettii]
MAPRRCGKKAPALINRSAKPLFDSLPDEILLKICKAYGCELARDKRFIRATEAAKAMTNTYQHEDDATFIDKHPRELRPESQNIAQVCTRLRHIYLETQKHIQPIAHAYFLFPETFMGFKMYEDVKHLKKVTISPLMGLKLHFDTQKPGPPTTSRYGRATGKNTRVLRMFDHWTMTRAWLPVVKLMSYLPDPVVTHIRWPAITKYIPKKDQIDYDLILGTFISEPMIEVFKRGDEPHGEIAYSIGDYGVGRNPLSTLIGGPRNGVTEVVDELNMRYVLGF